MTVTYEWIAEVIQNYADNTDVNDVVDVYHFDTMAEMLTMIEYPLQSMQEWHYGIVRDDNDTRSWAYVDNGELPLVFEDAYQRPVAKVPKRLRTEFVKGTT